MNQHLHGYYSKTNPKFILATLNYGQYPILRLNRGL